MLFPSLPKCGPSRKSSEMGPGGHHRKQGCLEKALSILTRSGCLWCLFYSGKGQEPRAGEITEIERCRQGMVGEDCILAHNLVWQRCRLWGELLT